MKRFVDYLCRARLGWMSVLPIVMYIAHAEAIHWSLALVFAAIVFEVYWQIKMEKDA